MQEFRIVVQNGSAKPYSLWTFSTFEACYSKLIAFIQYKSSQVKPEFYVLNDFYENKYPAFLNDITKYTIEHRVVNEWEKYSKEEEKQKNDNKIIYFDNYKKVLTK